MKQRPGNDMKEDFDSKQSTKSNIRIPSKLPSSLARNVCSQFWKNIIYSIENKDVETVLEVVKTIDRQKEVLCLPHPFIEGIDTFPFKSIRQGMCNFIFFNDETHENQWILCQCTSFVDAIFSKKYSGKHKLSTDQNVILNSIKQVARKENNSDLNKFETQKALFSGYALDQTRPYHHFYDQLKWLVHLNSTRSIICNKSFFIPRSFKKRVTETKKYPTFYMFPLVIGSNQLGIKLDKYSDKMEKIVYRDSLKDLYGGTFKYRLKQAINAIIKPAKENRTLTLWFGISGQKRIWIQQEEFLPTLVQQLKPWFDSFIFLIDGFTQYEYIDGHPNDSTGVNEDQKIVNSIKQQLMPFANVSVVNLIGQTYRKKIQQCQSVDFFIANAGAGQLIPHRFCKKKGILHSNEKHCVFSMGINNTTVKLVDKSLVKDVGNLFAKGKNKRANKSGIGFISYSIDVQVIVNMTVDMLKLKN